MSVRAEWISAANIKQTHLTETERADGVGLRQLQLAFLHRRYLEDGVDVLDLCVKERRVPPTWRRNSRVVNCAKLGYSISRTFEIFAPRMSTLPCLSSTRLAKAVMDASLATSNCSSSTWTLHQSTIRREMSTVRPSLASSATACWPFATSRDVSITWTSGSAALGSETLVSHVRRCRTHRCLATAKPMPWLAPVTTAIFFVSAMSA